MKVIYCPLNEWDCPYYSNKGYCMMYPSSNPIDECDDFASVVDEDDEYIVEPKGEQI